MRDRFDIQRFRAVRAQAADVLGLRRRAELVLSRRALETFDGFGHFLDAVLGDDDRTVNAVAETVHLPHAVIDQLRASELDPFSASLDSVAYLGFLLGISEGEFRRLIDVDHVRFAKYSDAVLSRSTGDNSPAAPERLQALWLRFEEDRATDL